MTTVGIVGGSVATRPLILDPPFDQSAAFTLPFSDKGSVNSLGLRQFQRSLICLIRSGHAATFNALSKYAVASVKSRQTLPTARYISSGSPVCKTMAVGFPAPMAYPSSR